MFRVEWLPEHDDILLQIVPAKWDVDDFVASVDAVVAILRQHPDKTIHLICNMSQSQQIPLGIASRAGYVSGQVQPNSGLIVLVGMGWIETEIFYAMRRLIHPLYRHIQLANTVPAAVALIQAERKRDAHSA